MSFALRFILVILTLGLLTVLHIGASYLLPFPYSKVNILLGSLLILLVTRGTGIIVWISFFSHFLIELYTVTPFGAVLFSSTLSMLAAYWLSKHVFTNYSWFATLALTACTLVLYRFLYSISLLLAALLSGYTTSSWFLLFTTFVWELLFTLLFVTIGYIAVKLMSPTRLTALTKS